MAWPLYVNLVFQNFPNKLKIMLSRHTELIDQAKSAVKMRFLVLLLDPCIQIFANMIAYLRDFRNSRQKCKKLQNIPPLPYSLQRVSKIHIEYPPQLKQLDIVDRSHLFIIDSFIVKQLLDNDRRTFSLSGSGTS